ncbi:MAG: histidine kinase [Sphingobacteriaceae bacterium]|nr:MAG: histidine kinase [Sphingobacteriaceae bacterium]
MKQQWKIFWHVFVWVCLLSLFFYFINNEGKFSLGDTLVIVFLYGAINIGMFYLNYLWLIPQYLDRSRYLQYVVMILVAMVLIGLAKYGIGLMFKDLILMHKKVEIGFWSYFASTIFTSLLFIFLSIVLKFSTDWFLNERIQRDLENQRLSAELSFLKSQINPHFLFNSLNSIYSLAYQKSETTPEAILKLSEIMRYMLYESNDNKVDLDKEVHYLQNYIDLQKIRFGYKAFVEFEVEGAITNQRIAPLLLISFVENAFKHGVASDPLSPIRMLLHVADGQIDFMVENKKHNHNRDASGGIGLNNVKRRLNLLYPDNYKLTVTDRPDVYITKLSLSL